MLLRQRFLVTRLAGGLLAWLGVLAPAWAQAPPAPWPPDPVLSGLLVQQLVFGPDGYGWVATDEGVRRYDGYAAVPLARLLRPGSAAAPTGYVRLALAPDSALWIGAESGLYRYRPATGQLTHLPLPLNPAERTQVNTLWRDARTGRLWLSYGNGRVLSLDPRRPRLPPRPPASRTNGAAVLSFAPATGGAVWATSDADVLVLDGHRGQLRRRYPNPGFFVVPVPGTRPQQVVSWQALFTVDSLTGRLREQRRWLRGPIELDVRFHPGLDAAGRPAAWLAQGRRVGLRWPGPVAGAGLPTVATTPVAAGLGGLAANRVYSLAHDASGLGWVFSPGFRGCYREGPPPAVRPLALARPLANPSVRGLARLPDGRLLASTYGGALTQAADSPRAPLRSWRLAYPAPDVRTLTCYDLLVSRAGRVLFANEGSGFGEVNPRTGAARDFASAPGTPPPALVQGHALVQDAAGALWGGAQSGLYQLDEARGLLTRYRSHDPAWPLNHCDVRSLAADAAGTLWLATDHGLYALSPATGRLRHYGPTEASPAARLPTADLLSVLPPTGPAGLVWLATRNAGLLGLDPARGVVRHLTALRGLPDAPLATLLPGPDGALWAGTYAGLVRYAPAPDQLTVYGPAEGLGEPELNQHAAFRDHDGTLYFGGIGGVYRVAAGPQPAPAPAPRLLFTARTRADTVAEWLPTGDTLAAGLRLPGAAAEAGLDLALTDFRNPAQAHFYYQVRPADGPTGPVQRTDYHLRLHGLAAGAYTLAVWGQTAAGQRSAIRRLALEVARPWWQHPAALAAGALLLLGLGAAAQWGRGRRQLREARLRARIAADLHDEVGALLTRVSMRAELLHHTTMAPAAAGPALDALLTDSRAAQATMRDMVWGIDAGADTIGALLDRLRDHLDQLAEPAGLLTHLAVHQLPDAQFLAPACRQHLYLLSKEAITNAVRHAHGATELRVELNRRGTSLYLRVTDDGCPAAPPGVGGLGLRNMQQRAQALGGHLTVGPRAEGPGWEVRFVVPYRRLVGGEA